MYAHVLAEPRAVEPHGEFAECVSTDELRTVLRRLIPTWSPFRVASAFANALRLWGPHATFDPAIASPFLREYIPDTNCSAYFWTIISMLDLQ